MPLKKESPHGRIHRGSQSATQQGLPGLGVGPTELVNLVHHLLPRATAIAPFTGAQVTDDLILSDPLPLLRGRSSTSDDCSVCSKHSLPFILYYTLIVQLVLTPHLKVCDAIKIKKRPQSIHPIVYRLLHLYYLASLSFQIIGYLTLLIYSHTKAISFWQIRLYLL